MMTTTDEMTLMVGMVGNLTADPELQISQAGKPWLRCRVGVKPFVPGATTQPEPEFYDVICFGTLAEHVAVTCGKGDRVVVTGRLEDDTWVGRDGPERTSQKLIAGGMGLDLRFTTGRAGLPMATTDVMAASRVVDRSQDAGAYDEPF